MLVYLRTQKETLRVRKNPDRPYLGSSSFITYQLYQRRNKMSGWCVLTEPVLALLVFSGAPYSWWLFHSSLGPQVEEFIFSPFLFMISSIPSVAKLATEVFHRSPVMTAVASAVTVSHEAHRSDCLPGPPYHDRPTDLKWIWLSLFYGKPLSCSPLDRTPSSSFLISFQDVIQPHEWSYLSWAYHIQNTEQLVTPSTCVPAFFVPHLHNFA